MIIQKKIASSKIIILHIFLITLISLSIRLFLLDKVPTGIADDELDFAMSAKSITINGSNITKSWNALSFTNPPDEYPKSEAPYLLLAPFYVNLNLNLFTSRLPATIYNTALVIVLYLLAANMFNSSIALIVGLTAAFNPWMIFFGRTLFEAPLSNFVYYTILLLFFKLKNSKILFIIPLLLFAFYLYTGEKTIFLPLIIFLSFYFYFTNQNYLSGFKSKSNLHLTSGNNNYLQKKFLNPTFLFSHIKSGKYYLLLIFASILIFSHFIFISNNSLRGRELLTPDSGSIVQRVIYERKQTLNFPFTNLATNKFTIFFDEAIKRYLGAFSVQLLFISGDTRSSFSLWKHGLFYYTDLIFLITGFYYLFKTSKKYFILLTGIILISPIPTVISSLGITYPLRSSLMYPSFILIIGFGIYKSIEFFKKRSARIFFAGSVILIYLIQFSNFYYIYIMQNPIYNSESYVFSSRVLANYINLAPNKVVFLTDSDSPTIF